jgi:hypothetical protein
MGGLLADVNVQGHLPYLRQLLEVIGLWPIFTELNLDFATFRDLQLSPGLDDRSLWNYCQQHDWVLFTENRNHNGANSLEATIVDSWQMGHLPVLTLANKGKFENSP